MPHPEDCLNQERFTKLEKAHADTADELKKINSTLIRIETTLSGKIVLYDKHIDDGEKFRNSVMLWLVTSVCGGLLIAGGFGIWVGRIDQQVKTNSDRWDRVLAKQSLKME
jgi:hypothetical protein